ncbi:unnamed protein product, partial [Allacma fusca]
LLGNSHNIWQLLLLTSEHLLWGTL